MADATDRPGDPAVERIDWDAEGQSPFRPSPATVAFLIALVLYGAAFLWDLLMLAPDAPTFGRSHPLGPWDVPRLEWLFGLGLLVALFRVVVPLAARPARTREYWRRLRRDRTATLSLAYLLAMLVVGVVGPVVLGRPELSVTHSYQPPVFASIPASVPAQCLGEVAGGRCHGTMQYPLGTTYGGKSVLTYTVAGTRTAMQVALITGTLIVPLGVAIGTTAAYLGGWVDAVLMRLVDVVQTIPPFFAYIVVRFIQGGGGDIVTMLLVFGLLSWGKVARMVRGEALSVAAEEYVDAARDAGGGSLYVVRRHLFPNVSSTAVTAATQQVAWLVLVEAALSYLGLGAPFTVSWGTIVAQGTQGSLFASGYAAWWVSVFPVAALAGTVVALNVLGDALRDVLDPRVW